MSIGHSEARTFCTFTPGPLIHHSAHWHVEALYTQAWILEETRTTTQDAGTQMDPPGEPLTPLQAPQSLPYPEKSTQPSPNPCSNPGTHHITPHTTHHQQQPGGMQHHGLQTRRCKIMVPPLQTSRPKGNPQLHCQMRQQPWTNTGDTQFPLHHSSSGCSDLPQPPVDFPEGPKATRRKEYSFRTSWHL